jgi:hypothetical protein
VREGTKAGVFGECDDGDGDDEEREWEEKRWVWIVVTRMRRWHFCRRSERSLRGRNIGFGPGLSLDWLSANKVVFLSCK